MKSCPKLTHLFTRPLLRGYISPIQAISFMAHRHSLFIFDIFIISLHPQFYDKVATEMIRSHSPFNLNSLHDYFIQFFHFVYVCCISVDIYSETFVEKG